jgi:hypothetical protein
MSNETFKPERLMFEAMQAVVLMQSLLAEMWKVTGRVDEGHAKALLEQSRRMACAAQQLERIAVKAPLPVRD